MRILSVTLLGIWLTLILIGKGGLVHLLLLNAIVIYIIDAVSLHRARMTEN